MNAINVKSEIGPLKKVLDVYKRQVYKFMCLKVKII